MWSISTAYLLFLATGFTVGFGHCIGMCGPIVVSLALNLKGKGVLLPHILYHGGRITTYALMGGVMGLTGSFTGVASSIAGFQKGAMIFAGVVIILMGLSMCGWVPFGKIFGDRYHPKGFITRGFQKLSGSKSVRLYYPLGLLLGLLPCGPVYTALIAAARSGMEARSALAGVSSGAGLMVAFGLGTVPALLLVARLAGMGWLKSRAAIYRVGALLVVIVGVYFVIKGIQY